jgi:beta-glucosidase
MGHALGELAPGLRDRRLALTVAHHVLLSHGRAVPLIRARCRGAQVGMVLNFSPAYPATAAPADQAAADLHDASQNRWFLDPVTGRGYPAAAWEAYGNDVPAILPGDMDLIAVPLDFLGINYYSRAVCQGLASGGDFPTLNRRDAANVTAADWEIFPQGLYDLLTWLHRNYGLARLLITENGAAFDDVLGTDGSVHDPARQRYLREHLEMALRAIESGVPLQGYFCWTLLDNFEWTYGTSRRFGLAYTDYSTQKRIVKDSGHWLGRVARANALVD